mgnify:CR=1 FL=1
MLAILQARTSSTRLPGKVLRPILGRPMLARQIERLQRSRHIGPLVVATSSEDSDHPLAALCAEIGIPCHRGALNDVLDRFYGAAAAQMPSEHVIRLTGDCPLADWQVIDACIDFHLAGNFDYSTNAFQPTFPDGLDIEVFRFRCLEEAWREAALPSEREHVTPFIHQRPVRYRIGHYRQERDLSWLRWTVDEPADFEVVDTIYRALYPANPAFTTADILDFLSRHPEVAALNSQIPRNEAYIQSLARDPQHSNLAGSSS